MYGTGLSIDRSILKQKAQEQSDRFKWERQRDR
jgi:hypothetical protein